VPPLIKHVLPMKAAKVDADATSLAA